MLSKTHHQNQCLSSGQLTMVSETQSMKRQTSFQDSFIKVSFPMKAERPSKTVTKAQEVTCTSCASIVQLSLDFLAFTLPTSLLAPQKSSSTQVDPFLMTQARKMPPLFTKQQVVAYKSPTLKQKSKKSNLKQQSTLERQAKSRLSPLVAPPVEERLL